MIDIHPFFTLVDTFNPYYDTPNLSIHCIDSHIPITFSTIESWNPMWSVSTIITGLISFMVETAPTLGSIETSTQRKKILARKSLNYNAQNKIFQKLFPDLVTLNEDIELRNKELGLVGSNSGCGNTSEITTDSGGDGNAMVMDDAMVQSLMAVFAGFVALMSIIFAMRFI